MKYLSGWLAVSIALLTLVGTLLVSLWRIGFVVGETSRELNANTQAVQNLARQVEALKAIAYAEHPEYTLNLLAAEH